MNHSWESISNHTCGRFKDQAEQKAAAAKKDLDRYMHYYSRWKAHMDSLKFEAEQESRVTDKISSLDSKLAVYLADYQWLCDGAAQLSACRRILANSYIFAYYVFGLNSMFADEITSQQDAMNRNLFEVKQEELEQAVESLSKLVEAPLEDIIENGSIVKAKQVVLDLTVNVDLRSLRLCETAQNDILGRLTTSQGIAPYLPRNQFVRNIARETSGAASLPPAMKRARLSQSSSSH